VIQVTVQFVEARASEECGCPEEHWIVGGIDTVIHMEENGEVHVHMDGGDAGETSLFMKGMACLDDCRDMALGWAKAMLFASHGWS